MKETDSDDGLVARVVVRRGFVLHVAPGADAIIGDGKRKIGIGREVARRNLHKFENPDDVRRQLGLPKRREFASVAVARAIAEEQKLPPSQRRRVGADGERSGAAPFDVKAIVAETVATVLKTLGYVPRAAGAADQGAGGPKA